MVFSQKNYNVQELENLVFKEREACVANIQFSGDVSNIEAVIEELKTNADIIGVSTCLSK